MNYNESILIGTPYHWELIYALYNISIFKHIMLKPTNKNLVSTYDIKEKNSDAYIHNNLYFFDLFTCLIYLIVQYKRK